MEEGSAQQQRKIRDCERSRDQFAGMLKSCLPYLGSPDCLDNNNNNESKSKDSEEGHNNSLNYSTFQSKHIFVRVVHAGGKVDHYPNAIQAGKLLENLPGKWLARPQVFKHPHQSIICPEEYLLPGHKYYVIPLSTIRKLKRKHDKMAANAGSKQVDITTRSEEMSSDLSAAVEASDYDHQSQEWHRQDYSFCSARDFYANNDKRSTYSRSHGPNGASSRRARILLPLPKPKPKACSGYTWEPGLTSIQELSP